jgi:hydrogenase large subunit
MATIKIIDPVTRIEGHMSVEVTIDQSKVTDARCTGTLFRGFETILNGRKPTDAPVITQRICGVCPISHGMASVAALDDVSDFRIPDNGRILRNLTLGANYIQSHILHFYFLTAWDFVKGPAMAPWAPAWDVDIRLPATHPIAAHLGQAVEARRRAHEMGAVFGGRMPTAHTFVPGGFTAVPTHTSIGQFKAHLDWLVGFIQNIYVEDVQALKAAYSDYLTLGVGYKNLLAFGAFDLDSTGKKKLFKRGVAEAGKTGAAAALSIDKITESVTHSWYDNGTNNLAPASGKTTPIYPKTDAYSWLKAPRYKGKPYEAGPLARMWVNGDYQWGVSVMDRHFARALEAMKVAKAMQDWLGQLSPGSPAYIDQQERTAGSGIGLTEAPRGALGHWVGTVSGKINHYQIITPTCWNASPRDAQHVPGPMEKALIGMPVKDAAKPIEVLRVIHSFDPCLSCAVHVIRPKRPPTVIRAGLALGGPGAGESC